MVTYEVVVTLPSFVGVSVIRHTFDSLPKVETNVRRLLAEGWMADHITVYKITHEPIDLEELTHD